MNKLFLKILCYSLLTTPVIADDIKMSSNAWTIDAKSHKFEMYKGKEAIQLDQGSITLKNLNFENGTLEYDVFMTYVRGFAGIRFRSREQDHQDVTEEFYIRSHLSGMPDATQYTPVFNGDSAWQLYHGPQYSSPYSFKENEWLHVKINVAGNMADIYLGDMEKPALTIDTLKTGSGSGKVSLYANFVPRHFANFSYNTETPTIIGKAAPMPATPDTRIKTWDVSSTFDRASLKGKYSLDEAFLQSLSWTPLNAEENGITNLSKISKLSKNNNTVFASKTIEAQENTNVTISLGYSDDAKIYLNGELLYDGSNFYQSRDYRYLGTIGLFDAVPLRLKKGKNILHIAVSEAFGGWGIMADLPKTDGVTIK